MSSIASRRCDGSIPTSVVNTCLSCADRLLYAPSCARACGDRSKSRSYVAFCVSLNVTCFQSQSWPSFSQFQLLSHVDGLPHLKSFCAPNSSPWKKMGMPGDAKPMPAANRAASRDHCVGKSEGLLPSAAVIVRCALPTSSWFEIIDSGSSTRRCPAGWSACSRTRPRPSSARAPPPGSCRACWLSFTIRCWDSVYHCASKPPPVPSDCAGSVRVGS